MRILCILIAMLQITSVYAGSLYNPESYQSLASDNRARKVGDTLTILVVEQTQAKSSVDSNSDRKTGINANVSSNKIGHTGDLNVGSKYTNGGQVSRTGNLLARVTVTVKQVMPNGDLKIEGQQVIKINKEKQLIKISGIVSVNGISSNNTVVSNYVANMNMVYSGDGPLGREKKPGIVIRMFRWVF